MDTSTIIINVLIGLLGLFAGGALAFYTPVVRRLNELSDTTTTHTAEIKNLIRQDSMFSRQLDACGKCQVEQTALIRKMVDQNNLLIQKIIAHAD